MKLFITVVVALVVGVGLALLAQHDPGYVVLTREPYVVRLPMLLFVMIVMIVFALLYLAFNFIAGVLRAPKKYRNWRSQSHQNSAHKHTMLGYAGLIEGNWSKAEESLLKNLGYNKTPMMNYLGAAYAAHQQGQMARRDQYFEEVLSKHPNHRLAINLTRARLHYQAGEIPQARDYLEQLRTSAPRNGPVVRLLADIYRELQDWNSLVKLMPAIKKLNVFPEDELVKREHQAYDHLISSPALLQGDGNRPNSTWKSLPSAKRKNPAMVISYAKQLLRADRIHEAEAIIRKALYKKYDSDLMEMYGKIKTPTLVSQIKLVESFIKKHGEDPALKLSLARLYRFQDDLEKSKTLFEEAMEMGVSEDVYVEYASLLEQFGDTTKALYFYKKRIESIGAEGDSDPSQHPDQAQQQGEIVLIEGNSQQGDNSTMPVVR